MNDVSRPHFTSSMARTMLIEGQAATLVLALRRAGIPSLLLKGVTLDRWLYAYDGRTYGDVDVLVPPDRLHAAERLLHGLGYVNKYDGASPDSAEEHADAWLASDGSVPVDLHRRVWGIGVGPDRAWQVLWAGRRPLRIGATEVDAPSEPANALLVALHAAHHGLEHPRPMEDLRRVLDRMDDATWADVVDLAGELGAQDGLAAGLGLVPAGSEVRERLGLRETRRRELRSDLWSAPPTTAGFLRVLEARSTGARVRIVLREAFPSRAFMRSSSHGVDAARAGSAGLVRAYVARLGGLARAAPRGFRTAVSMHRRSTDRTRIERPPTGGDGR